MLYCTYTTSMHQYNQQYSHWSKCVALAVRYRDLIYRFVYFAFNYNIQLISLLFFAFTVHQHYITKKPKRNCITLIGYLSCWLWEKQKKGTTFFLECQLNLNIFFFKRTHFCWNIRHEKYFMFNHLNLYVISSFPHLIKIAQSKLNFSSKCWIDQY